jgi:glucosamine kinase
VICVADSGSTKTDWVALGPQVQEEIRFKTIGLNPFFVSETLVSRTVSEAKPESLDDQVQAVYFYGAGCSSAKRNEIIERGLKEVFPNAKIEVFHDLLGAARACCQHEEGIASILGTGSNSCLYNGEKIIDNVTNLGYVLGDEGSGGHIGKQLIRARSYREMPSDIQEDFDAMFGYDHEEMLQAIYHNPLPNRFLASFAPFCSKHREHQFVQDLVKGVFGAFVRKHLVKYGQPEMPHHFLGSVAKEFESELKSVMDEHGLRMGRVMRKPIDLLMRYHLDEHEF